ncbi:MAG: HAMP domain-containing protein [Gaiellales bacterium]|nr:HAMP domain-containing protein [Gaiellales bacterium]
MRLRLKLPLAFALTTLILAALVALVAAIALRSVYLDRLEDDMSLQARQFAAVLRFEASTQAGLGPADLQVLAAEAGDAGGMRLTVVARDGTVLADSEADPGTLDNHADRPEVARALAGNEARARRESATLGRLEVYVAIPLPAASTSWSSGVLRVAQSAGRIDALLVAAWRVPLVVWAIMLLPILLASYFLTRSIFRPVESLRQMTRRVASGDLTARNSVRRGDELGELAEALNTMASQLEARVGQLAAEQDRSSRLWTALSDGVIVVDAEGRLLRANAAAGRILGARLEGEEGNPLVHVVRSFPGRALAQKATAAGMAVTEVLELPGPKYVVIDVIPLEAVGAEQRQTLFVLRDETVRLSTERMRRDFATNVSHELKTPLAALSLLAETLKHAVREDPSQAEVFADRLSAEVRRLTELAADLLTLSRLEEPDTGVRAVLERMDLGLVAEETAAEFATQVEAKSQELSVDADEPAEVLGDEQALRTMARNLLDNAVRYTGPGGHIAVAVHNEVDTRGRCWALLTVRDNGAGIPQSEQQRIFERFYRVDKARSRETGGTGLGLSIVRHVADRHGGRVEVVSAVGVGSTFTVRIPRAEEDIGPTVAPAQF